MSSSAPSTTYRARIVPALHRIQHEFGYLKREGMVAASKELGVPLHRLHAVASFFPHFRLSPPPKKVLRICRDLSCHMAGGSEMIKQLQALAGPDVAIEGVSCLGRCDRAPAALVATAGHEHDDYYLGRSAEELEQIVTAHLGGETPKPDYDADLPYRGEDFVLNPYGAKAPDYAGVRKALAVRDASLDAAAKALAGLGWTPGRIEQFRLQATRRQSSEDPEIAQAVLQWATDDQWAKGPTLGAWSEVLLKEIEDAKLRGLGGAGIPSPQKLRDVRDAIRKARKQHRDDRGFIVVNGDESEPGTFKDREILLRIPHVVVEGVIIAGLLTEATQGFIYIRHEYAEQIEACRAEIRRAEEFGLCGENAFTLGRAFPLSVFVSPGGYICGEQSALIEAMSDRRGEPRNLPPKLETNGLDDMPTIVSNVETYSWIPYICINGGKTYSALGENGWCGRRLFSISGDVKRPGVYEVPMGMTLRELVCGEAYCQGVIGDRKLKGFAPSGPSGGFLPAKLTARAGLPRNHLENAAWKALAQRRGFDPTATELDILDLELELDLFRAISPTQALGAGLVVYAEGRDMADQAVNSLEFYRNESCGKCVPCRVGSQKYAALGAHLLKGNISAERWKNELIPLLGDMSKAIEMSSICGLGRSVPVPLRTVANYFEPDLNHYLT
jgi:NADH:ubiquinone oxidoreductase subunit F (NADH-binding)/NADH:ubiquinone oxidoreductase subunit E